MKRHRFFGMIIPKQYGGHGFSASANSAVVGKVASANTVLGITVMVPNSPGPAELLIHYGTRAQKDYYLPRLARHEDIPAFALTGPQAGSDAGGFRGYTGKPGCSGDRVVFLWPHRCVRPTQPSCSPSRRPDEALCGGLAAKPRIRAGPIDERNSRTDGRPISRPDRAMLASLAAEPLVGVVRKAARNGTRQCGTEEEMAKEAHTTGILSLHQADLVREAERLRAEAVPVDALSRIEYVKNALHEKPQSGQASTM